MHPGVYGAPAGLDPGAPGLVYKRTMKGPGLSGGPARFRGGIDMSGNPLLGVDIGGTRIKLGLCDRSGLVLVKEEAPTPQAADGGLTVEALADVVRRFLARHGLTAADVPRMGVGVPGVVQDGCAWAVNLGWNGLNLAHPLRAMLGIDPVLENDANAAAWAEYRAGAGVDVQDLVLLTLGTGVGCGIISGGRLFRGAHGQAGEIGHITVDPEGAVCTCGKRGCLETKVGTYALLRRAGQEGEREVRRIFEAAQAGDRQAAGAIAEMGAYLGIALGTVVDLLDPSAILIGGGIARAGRPLFALLEAEMARQLGSQIRSRPAIRPALLGNDAGLLGCAFLSE